MSHRFAARYLIETSLDPQDAAAEMAGESSTATFVAIPGERASIAERHGARIDEIVEVETPLAGSIAHPSASAVRRCEVKLSWPLENTGTSLPNMLATFAGNIFDVQSVSALRLVDVELPSVLADAYAGPQFGVEGTRRVTQIEGMPIIGTIVKPSVGLTPDETASLVERLAEGGIDFIKDDELMADPPHCPFDQRVDAVLDKLRRYTECTGRKVMYAFNITGEVDEMLRRHDKVLASGGNCVMVSLNWIGLPALARLRRHSQLPIHGHRNGFGTMSRAPGFGVDFRAWHKLFRIAGADHIHVNGLDNKFYESNESVVRSAQACVAPVFGDGGPVWPVMPVFSSKQTVWQALDTYRAMKSTDLIYACGGGILGHPDGIASGVESIKEAWAAALEGVSLDDYAIGRPALARALGAFAA
ncbi:ribulose-bisphosphate carboxylase large subunit family protein [Paraburkholderia sediminicola]|uniref:Ribulose-bisphosphate carboxylase large subunit family protein n=1 Tax=Paraburkholderia rhynchosiae TaxID=487049 RepID=A0ACC7NPW7_9BURK